MAANTNLYASREGMLYQSYDNYAGAAGFYDPSQEQQQQQQIGSAAPTTTAASSNMSSSCWAMRAHAQDLHRVR